MDFNLEAQMLVKNYLHTPSSFILHTLKVAKHSVVQVEFLKIFEVLVNGLGSSLSGSSSSALIAVF